MRRPYDDEEDDEDPWDAELDPDELVENPSSADIDTSVQQAYEDEFGDDEEETSLDDFNDTDADAADEFGDNEDEFGNNEEENGAETPDLGVPAVRTASLGRLRGRVRLPESEPETSEETPETDEFGDMKEDGGALTDSGDFGEDAADSPVQTAPPPRRRHARPPRHEHQVQDTSFADNDVSPEENDEPMYDNVGLGGFANKLVSLFSRGRK